jgi:hypothetical protein
VLLAKLLGLLLLAEAALAAYRWYAGWNAARTSLRASG